MTLSDAYVRSGKVRDLFGLDGDRLLLVASDRISAFDVVLPSTIPDKGLVLTALSRFWFAETRGIVANHLLATDPAAIPDGLFATGPLDPASGPVSPSAATMDRTHLRGRMMLCRRTEVLPVEVIVRGYLTGTGWRDYQATGAVCGVSLPAGLIESERLAEPILAPSTKAEAGRHDTNIDFDSMATLVGGDLAERIRDLALRLFGYASAISTRAGIILADTKFEFGVDATGELLLIDEALTPDSSRFWEASSYEPGRAQASFDKQFVRDWLDTQSWDKTDPGPPLPEDVIAGTRARYIDAYERIAGANFERYRKEDIIAS